MAVMEDFFVKVCVVFVLLGTLPLLTAFLQFFLVGVHGLRNHYRHCALVQRRVAILIPAWNEAAVIEPTVERLMAMNYPRDCLRVYVIDDASTDGTPEAAQLMVARYPQNVVHLRREKGGEGKAHTLNHGLQQVLADDWAQAVLITDADVIFEPDSLARMMRHLADPKVGAVTAYIKEGSPGGNFITRSVAYEYITAQAAARRAQNLMGVMACMAGGAQLHSRENLEAIGGRIDTTTLAEDTYTTFLTELGGRKTLFDGYATVWAEEPGTITGLWKQRLRWARGNLQMTWAFKHAWFRPGLNPAIGGFVFGLIWFVTLLMPALMLLAMVGQVSLFFLHDGWAWQVFRLLWITNIVVYLFVLLFSLVIDRATAKRAWLEGILFPGLLSLIVMVFSVLPGVLDGLLAHRLNEVELHGFDWHDAVVLFMYAWVGLCMLPAWLIYRLEKAGGPPWLVQGLLIIVGYGPLLCAIALAAFVAELRGADRTWDKTIKAGGVQVLK